MIEFKLNKYKFHSIMLVSQFGFWRQLEVVGANVEQAQSQGDPIQGFSIYGHFSLCSSLRTAFC